ncbi:MAG: hypothetical protein GX066_08915 [Clostridiaceae bacterium]|nr:hypothetical protein [Clostridiaceae bacterium]
MQKCSDVIGLPVISLSTGEKIGFVKDILLDSDTKKIKAFVIYSRNIFSKPRAVLSENIVRVGKGAVLVRDREKTVSVRELMSLPNIRSYKEGLVNQPVYTDSGVDLGVVQDAIFNFEIGQLDEIEVSDGIVQDLMEGRKIISASESLQLEQGIVIVETEKVRAIRKNGKGIKKYIMKGSKEDEK